MNTEVETQKELLGPHLKLWAVVEGPVYELLPDGEDSWYLEIRASGPMDHEEVRNIRVFFYSEEDANINKREIDYSAEPIIKELSDE